MRGLCVHVCCKTVNQPTTVKEWACVGLYTQFNVVVIFFSTCECIFAARPGKWEADIQWLVSGRSHCWTCACSECWISGRWAACTLEYAPPFSLTAIGREHRHYMVHMHIVFCPDPSCIWPSNMQDAAYTITVQKTTVQPFGACVCVHTGVDSWTVGATIFQKT